MGRQRKYGILGCKLWGNCETCPYPECIESGHLRRSMVTARRNRGIARLRTIGLDIATLSTAFNISTRMIYRILERYDLVHR